MKPRLIAFLALAGLLLACVPMFAHHGGVAYDETKLVTMKATVVKYIWANPHTILLFDVKDDKGKVVHWTAETGSPSAMTNAGWNRNSLNPGDEITIYLHQSKLGSPAGRFTKVVLADGTVLNGA